MFPTIVLIQLLIICSINWCECQENTELLSQEFSGGEQQNFGQNNAESGKYFGFPGIGRRFGYGGFGGFGGYGGFRPFGGFGGYNPYGSFYPGNNYGYNYGNGFMDRSLK